MKIFPKLPEVIQREIDDFYSTAEKLDCDGILQFRGGSPRKRETELLAQLVLTVKPEFSVDWGLGDGAATMAIVLSRRFDGSPSRHVSLDPFQHSISKDVGLIQMRTRGLMANLEFREDLSEDFLVQSHKANREFDFIFVDGDHSFLGKIADAFLLDRVLKPGGVVVFHDSLFQSTSAAVTSLIRDRNYSVLNICIEPKWKVLARVVRHIRRLGCFYSFKVIPFLGISLAALQKQTTTSYATDNW